MNAWQLVLGCVTAVASITAAILSWRAGRSAMDQRENQALREEWWSKYQWAIELALSIDEYRAGIGTILLMEIAQSPLANEAEIRAARSALEVWLSRTVDRELEPPYTETGTVEEKETDDD